MGKKSSFANEKIFRTEALELDEPLPSSSPQSSSSSCSVSVFDRYRLKGLEQRKNTGRKKAGGCVCLQPKESRTKDEEEELGKKSSFANERIFRTEALELGRTAAFELSAIVLVVVLVVGLLGLWVLLVNQTTK